MKRLWLLLMLLLCCSLCGYGQFTNASGSAAKTYSATLGGYTWGVQWNNFTLASVTPLPSDSVIQGIYPVIVASGHFDIAFQYLQQGPNINFSGLGFSHPYATAPIGPGASFGTTEFWGQAVGGDSIGTSLSVLLHQSISMALNSSLLQNPTTDTIASTGIGYAIYYTSATPIIDTIIPAPFSVPSGQGIAWALPQDVQIIGPPAANGIASGLPATSSAPIKGIVGQINYPNANGFNGYLHMSLPNGTIKNTCTTPFQVVPRFDSTFAVVNGIVQFNNTKIVSNDCLMPRFAYNTELDDLQKNLKYLDNWYFPQSSDIKYDAGSLQAENFGGPITIAIPKGVIQNPSQSQSIIQPAGTSLDLEGTIIINGVTFATKAGGITYSGLLLTNPTISQQVTQPGGTFLNLIGDVRVNGVSITTGGFITSFNGRGGPAITPTTGDYTCAQVTGCITTSTANYQIVSANSADKAQEHRLNFGTDFDLSDNPGVATNVVMHPTGVSNGTYAFPSSITVGADGRISAIASSGTLPVNITQSVVTGSRTFGTTFHNTSGSALLATGYGTTSGSSTGSITCNVGSGSPSQVIWSNQVTATVSSGHAGFECPVPNGFFYSVTVTGAVSSTPGLWVESTF